MVLVWVGPAVLKDGSAFKLGVETMGIKAVVWLLDTGSQGLWRKRGLIEAWKGMSTNWWDHWLPVVTGSFWASCVPSILQATAIITTWPDFYCLGRVCDLWGTSQWSPLDFPDCLITLALVFLTWFSPAVAGSEHMKDVTHWQPRPVSWLVWRLILYGRKRCLVYSSMNTSAWARK